MNICEYGCGQKANHQLKNKKWCCSESHTQCPHRREMVSGKNNPFYNKKHTEKSKNLIAQKNKNHSHEPWNKGMKNCFSENTILKMSESHKGRIPWNKGKQMSSSFKKKRSLMMKGKNNPSWKGGYSLNGFPLYDTYAKKLTIEESPKRDILDKNILTVQCTNSSCRKRFIPSLSSVMERVRALKGSQNGEMRLYCSEECKQSCSIYWKQPIYNSSKKEQIYTQQEYNQFRNYVLERDNHTCQYCGEKAEHVHHERSQKLEPFFSLDPDLAWSVCKKCHYEKGHKDECSTGQLANIICNNEVYNENY